MQKNIRVRHVPSEGSVIFYGITILLLLGILGISIAMLIRQGDVVTIVTTSQTTTVAPTTTPSIANVACGADIQSAVNALTEVILTSPCVYNVTSTIVLRSGTIFRAYPADRGAVLRLADGANQAVILIGNSLEDGLSAPLITNVVVRDIAIDGNKNAQSSETTPGKPWLRNNGIDIRHVSTLLIDNVYIHDSRSGAIVASWDSSDILVSNSLLTTSFFDGIALYTSTDILVTNCNMQNNVAAGISIDNNLLNTRFESCNIHNNGDVGIFQRWASNITYASCQVYNNGNHGAFLSWNSPTPGTGVNNTVFTNTQFTNNVGRGINLDSPAPESVGTAVTSCTLSGNLATTFSGPNGGTLPSCAQIVVFDGGGNPPSISLTSTTCV